MSHENSPVQSVAKALRLLDLLMEAHQPLTLAALSEQTGWPKSTIHGLLSTMRESAVVDQQSDGRYCLGVRLFEYGCAVGASWSVSDLAKPHLQHLASVTGQSVFLSMLNRSEVITIEQVQSRAGLRVVSEVGTRLPLHCTSQGKVFLSAMADHEAKRVLSRRTLEPYTPKTLVTWEELFRVMQAARENGYAVEDGEYRFGLCSASAPVRDSSGAVRYAVGFVGMFDSVRSPDFQRDIDLTCAAAAQSQRRSAIGRKQRNFVPRRAAISEWNRGGDAMAIKRKFPPRVATVYCSGGCRAKRMRTAERSSSAARTTSSSRRTASTPTSSAARRRPTAGSCKKRKRARRGLISPRSFGMRSLTAAHRCENGENVSAKLCVRCLDIYHAQHYNKTHKKPPFAAFLRVSS